MLVGFTSSQKGSKFQFQEAFDIRKCLQDYVSFDATGHTL